MKFAEYLETYQPLVYKTFKNSLERGRLAHAYLLSGESGVPLLQTAIFLAKSLLCDKPSPLACESCRSCLRIEHRTYSDFVVLDGKESAIKKGDVQEIVEDFSRTPLEAKGLLIYVINLVENMNIQAINSLLKFLEEPPPGTYAFLTCENEAKVLPTIVSRCEKLRMVLVPNDVVIEDALKEGVSQEDAELLVSFVNNGALLKEEAQSKDYQMMKSVFLESLNVLADNPEKAVFYVEKDLIPFINGNKSKTRSYDAKFYLDLLLLAFKDAVSFKANQPLVLRKHDNEIRNISLLPHLELSLLEIMKARNLLSTNLNVALNLTHLFLFILER